MWQPCIKVAHLHVLCTGIRTEEERTNTDGWLASARAQNRTEETQPDTSWP